MSAASLDDPTPGAVEDPQALLALREGRLVDHVVGVVRQRHVHRDVVGLGKEDIQGHRLDLHPLGPAGRKVGVVGDHPHPEGLGAARHLAANAAKPHDAEGLSEKLDTGKGLAVPLAGAHRGGRLGHGAGPAEDMGERELGRGDRVARGRVHDDHPPLRRSVDVDIVHSDTGPAHDLQERCGGEDLGRDLGLRADGDRMDVLHQLEDLAGEDP